MSKLNKPIVFSEKVVADANGNYPKTIELARVGDWNTPWHGDFELTRGDLLEAVDHFDAGVYRVNGDEPLSGSLDHMGGPSAFRIDRIYVEGEVLQADVTWTELGKEKLDRDEYRYVSFEFNPRGMPFENPEKSGDFLNNVLTGATLTNDPLFKKQKPVRASARTGGSDNKPQGGESMNLDELRSKSKDELDEAQKKFVEERKAELTDDERKNLGLEEAPKDEPKDVPQDEPQDEPKDEPKDEPSDVKASAGLKTIPADKLAKLEAAAAAGLEAQAKWQKKEAEDIVLAHVKAGRIKGGESDKAVSLLLASTGKQRQMVEDFMKSLPENQVVASARGDEGDDANAADRLTREVASVMASAKDMTYKQALAKVQADKPELYKAYQDEMVGGN